MHIAAVSRALRRGIPALELVTTYNSAKLLADAVAGVTVGLTLIPQSIAYASLAGLSPERGLYSSLLGGVIYAVFGTVPELNVAPTALLSLLTLSYTDGLRDDEKAPAAALLCLLSGVVELLCGILHLGFLINFVSSPVVAAFTTAGALTIASSQVKNLLGLEFAAEGFASTWREVVRRAPDARRWDALLGLSCGAALLLLRRLRGPRATPALRRTLWFVTVARNALVVVFSALLAFVLQSRGMTPFRLTPDVPGGLPSLTMPISAFERPNATLTTVDAVRRTRFGFLVIGFVAILGNVAIAKAFAKGKVVDASQEMVAVGLCNVLGSFFGSYPVNASFSRGAVGSASGVRTPMAGIYASAMVALALTFLTPYFPYIPKATLAAVIICALIFMVEITITRLIWRTNCIRVAGEGPLSDCCRFPGKDLAPFAVTLVACLVLSIEIGILFGIFVDIVLLLLAASKPKILIDKKTDSVFVTLPSEIRFPSAEYIRDVILKESQNHRKIIIDCRFIQAFDFTAIKGFVALLDDCRVTGTRLIFSKANDSLKNAIKQVANNVEAENINEIFENNQAPQPTIHANHKELINARTNGLEVVSVNNMENRKTNCELLSTTKL